MARASRLRTFLLPHTQRRERGGCIRSSERVQREPLAKLRRGRLSERLRSGHAWPNDKSVLDEMVWCFTLHRHNEAALTSCRYHWSVEYFEDLRNVNHCEFITMDKDKDNGKFLLKSELRTWSELKKQRAIEAAKEESSRDESHQPQSPIIDPKRRNTVSQFLPNSQPMPTPPPARKWGGCVAG